MKFFGGSFQSMRAVDANLSFSFSRPYYDALQVWSTIRFKHIKTHEFIWNTSFLIPVFCVLTQYTYEAIHNISL